MVEERTREVMVEMVVQVEVWVACETTLNPAVVRGYNQLVEVADSVQTVGHSPGPRLDSPVGPVVGVQHRPVWVRIHKVEMGVLV